VIASKRKVEHREGKTLEYQNISKYTCESVDLTLQFKQEIHPLIDRSKAKKIYYELELPLVKVLADMEFGLAPIYQWMNLLLKLQSKIDTFTGVF